MLLCLSVVFHGTIGLNSLGRMTDTIQVYEPQKHPIIQRGKFLESSFIFFLFFVFLLAKFRRKNLSIMTSPMQKCHPFLIRRPNGIKALCVCCLKLLLPRRIPSINQLIKLSITHDDTQTHTKTHFNLHFGVTGATSFACKSKVNVTLAIEKQK